MRLHVPNGILQRADADVSDLTTSRPVGPPQWVPGVVDVLEIPFAVEPTLEEQRAIRRRLLTADADQEARAKAMQEALADLSSSGKVAAALKVVLRELLGPLAE